MTQMIDLRRRGLLRGSGITVLSASAVALLAGCEKMAVAQTGNGNAANDIGILNTALALENEAISAYQLGAQSGLLQKPVLEVAVLFQSHHKEHRDALIATIRKLGGTPVRGQERRRGGAGAERRLAQEPDRRAASCAASREGRGQRLYRRHPVVRRPRPGAGLGAARRRRDHALDGADARR